MKVVCAWCQRERKRAGFDLDEEDYLGEPISHGICDEHVVVVLAEARRAMVGAGATERLAS